MLSDALLHWTCSSSSFSSSFSPLYIYFECCFAFSFVFVFLLFCCFYSIFAFSFFIYFFRYFFCPSLQSHYKVKKRRKNNTLDPHETTIPHLDLSRLWFIFISLLKATTKRQFCRGSVAVVMAGALCDHIIRGLPHHEQDVLSDSAVIDETSRNHFLSFSIIPFSFLSTKPRFTTLATLWSKQIFCQSLAVQPFPTFLCAQFRHLYCTLVKSFIPLPFLLQVLQFYHGRLEKAETIFKPNTSSNILRRFSYVFKFGRCENPLIKTFDNDMNNSPLKLT